MTSKSTPKKPQTNKPQRHVRKSEDSSKKPISPKKFQKLADKPYEPRWELYKDGLTQAALTRFLTCRHQFFLHYLEGYRKKKSTYALEYGTVFHNCLEVINTNKPLDKEIRLALHQNRQRLKIDLMDATERSEFEMMFVEIGTQLPLYYDHWQTRNSEYEWVYREYAFSQRFRKGMSVDTSHLPIYDIPLRGRFDGVFRRRIKGEKKSTLWLHETKTKSRIDQMGITGMLKWDMQTMLYCYVLQQMTGEYPAGVIYDVIQTPQLQIRKGRGEGAGESLPDYGTRLKADIISRPSFYFHTWEVSLEPDDLDRWTDRVLHPTLVELQSWYEEVLKSCKTHKSPWYAPSHRMNPAALFTAYGRADLFEMITGGPTLAYHQTNVPYPELLDK